MREIVEFKIAEKGKTWEDTEVYFSGVFDHNNTDEIDNVANGILKFKNAYEVRWNWISSYQGHYVSDFDAIQAIIRGEK